MTRRTTLLAALVLAAVWATQFALLAPTNFTRTDEWLYVSLTSRGIVDCPHMQRPLALLWALPGALLRHRFVGFHLTDGVYVLLSGWLVFWLGRRLSGDVRLALLAGVLALVWAPRDMNRLLTVQATVAAGPTFATLLAFVLLVESWVRRRALLLALAAAVAIVTVRSYEATAALMLGGPLLVIWMAGYRARRAWMWAGAFAAVVVLTAALTALFLRRPEASYQFALGFDPRPGAVLGRLGLQFGWHLLPLVAPPPGLWTAAVGVSVAVFALGYGLVTWSLPASPPDRPRLAGLATLGGLLAALGYLPFCLLSSIQSATRTQFLSGPGIALLLAAGATLVCSFLPAPARQAGPGLFGAWVVAFGTGNTVAMQGLWTEMSAYPAQVGLLRQLTARAPDVRPHTLVVLLDDGEAFPAVFTFRHAVGYLYDQRAAGVVWGASDYLYSFSFDGEGVRLEPWPAIRKAWRDEPTRYGYGELIVARSGPDRRLALVRDWPAALPPLPPSARYDPEARIVRGGAPVPAQQILGRP
ncbi:MAG TPA: hypothetical protein VGN09_29220 [Vicinamibacteria bacterium]